MDAFGEPRFWGEAGKVSRDKIASLTRRYQQTHFAMAKWATGLAPYVELVEAALAETDRAAPFDLIAFDPDAATRFIDERGHIDLSFDEVDWVRL